MRAALTALPLVTSAAPLTPAPASPQPTLTELGWSDELASSLRAQLFEKAKDMPGWRRGRVAYVVREDGVELTERHELANHYRRHGLRQLAIRVRQAPIGIDLIVLEGDEVAIFSCDLARWAADLRSQVAIARELAAPKGTP